MSYTYKSSAVIAVLLLSACATSEKSETQETVAEADEKICRTESELGSHMKKTVCRTQAEWDEAERQGADYMDALTKGPSKVDIPTVGR